MAFYAHFSQSIFLHTYASSMYTFLAVGATDICCTKVCLSYVCKSEMWQNKQLLGYFLGEKLYYCLVSYIENMNAGLL